MDRVAILPGDMHVLFDGGKDGNHWKTKAAFVRDQGNALMKVFTGQFGRWLLGISPPHHRFGC